MAQPNSVLSMDSQIHSVIEIGACMVEEKETEYLKVFQISKEAMIHSLFNYSTKILSFNCLCQISSPS